MTADERERFREAVAEEQQGRAENVAAAKELLPALLRECDDAVAMIAKLREAREAAGVSLAEMESRTGIRKSALSRLENSRAPNPTLATLQRYAEAIGKRLSVSLEDVAR